MFEDKKTGTLSMGRKIGCSDCNVLICFQYRENSKFDFKRFRFEMLDGPAAECDLGGIRDSIRAFPHRIPLQSSWHIDLLDCYKRGEIVWAKSFAFHFV